MLTSPVFALLASKTPVPATAPESVASLHGWRRLAVDSIKAVHSFAFFVIQTCILYLVYSGFRRQSDRRAAIAAGVALAESAIYAGNGFRCPLTDVAERLGASSGSVTDIYLPRWLAANVARIYTPLLVLGIYLHARNLLARTPPS